MERQQRPVLSPPEHGYHSARGQLRRRRCRPERLQLREAVRVLCRKLGKDRTNGRRLRCVATGSAQQLAWGNGAHDLVVVADAFPEGAAHEQPEQRFLLQDGAQERSCGSVCSLQAALVIEHHAGPGMRGNRRGQVFHGRLCSLRPAPCGKARVGARFAGDGPRNLGGDRLVSGAGQEQVRRCPIQVQRPAEPQQQRPGGPSASLLVAIDGMCRDADVRGKLFLRAAALLPRTA